MEGIVTPNSVYMDTGVRITLDIDEAENEALISYQPLGIGAVSITNQICQTRYRFRLGRQNYFERPLYGYSSKSPHLAELGTSQLRNRAWHMNSATHKA